MNGPVGWGRDRDSGWGAAKLGFAGNVSCEVGPAIGLQARSITIKKRVAGVMLFMGFCIGWSGRTDRDEAMAQRRTACGSFCAEEKIEGRGERPR
jgi:hypothetical protein